MIYPISDLADLVPPPRESTEPVSVDAPTTAVSANALTGGLPRLIQESAADRWMFGILALALIAGFFLGTHAYWAPAHPGTDQNGYLVGGKLFAATASTGFKPADPFSFVGRMWVESTDGKFFPKYPLGLSIIYAITLKIGGVSSPTTGNNVPLVWVQ